MADFSFVALKDEIENDPLTLGYKNSGTSGDWKGDQVIADLINNASGANPRTVNFEHVDTGDIRSDVEFDWFDGLVTAEQAWFEWLTQNGVVKVNAHMLQQLAGIPTTGSNSIWAAADRTAANAAMAALMQFQGSRAQELWGEGRTVSAGDVGRAFNEI